MVVIGVAIGRLRSGITFINRKRIVQPDRQERKELPSPDIVSRMVGHNNVPLHGLPDVILDRILKESEARGTPISEATVGLLSLPFSESGDCSKKLELVRLHGILDHELRKLCKLPIQTVTIGTARVVLGITERISSSAKRRMIEIFKLKVENRDECVTNSGYQSMAESFSVAMELERHRVVQEIREVWPDVVNGSRKDVMHRNLFQRSTAMKIKESVFEELVEAEVNRQLVKRFIL